VPRSKANQHSQITFASVFSPAIDPQIVLEQRKVQPSLELIESSLGQLKLRLPGVRLICNSLSNCRLYSSILHWGHNLVSSAISSGQIVDALHEVVTRALAAGWTAHESGVEARILRKLVLEPRSTASAPSGSHKVSRKAGRQ
jgi:hypothetical protein